LLLVAFMRARLHWDVFFVLEHDELRRARDVEHFRLARQLRRTLVTLDRDYLDDRRFPLDECAGVLVVSGPDERLLARLPASEDAAIQAMVDGNMVPHICVPCVSIVKGDARSQSIAAASIVDKVTRDRIMNIYDRVFPQYGFAVHKGYATERHRDALRDFGRSLIHRKSFDCG
jgi:hypothetical protein